MHAKIDWHDINRKVTDYQALHGGSVKHVLPLVAPKVNILSYYSARGKILKQTSKKAPKKKAFKQFVEVSQAPIKITHPSGCVIECSLEMLTQVLNSLKN